MAKKSFKDNPALQFISSAEEERAEPEREKPTGKPRTGTKSIRFM